MPTRLPDIPALFGVLQYLLLATDIALSVGHWSACLLGDIGCPTRSVMSTDHLVSPIHVGCDIETPG